MSLLQRLEQLSPRKLALLALDLQLRLDAVEAERDRTQPVAIVAMSCRFPGANTPEAFWDLLREGRHAVTEVPAGRWDVERYFDPDPERPGRMHVRHGGFLEEVDRFDAAFFGISPREAASMDPQHRLLLEVVWEALERGGQNPAALKGSKTGVFVGISTSDYTRIVAAGGPEYADAYLMTGTALNFAAGRVSYTLGLQGPSLAVDTACSSSLAAVHLACRSLRAGDCDLALAAGVNLILQPDGMVVASKARMLSPAGMCRTFDAEADGIVRAEGCGVVLLKPLRAALDARDPVLAVIRGSAMNQDGRSSGITVPNGLAQEALIRAALQDGAVEPGDVSYIEAHGTGTRLGDPIEMRALAAVFGNVPRADTPLLVGSVKTNIGHAESAAGVAGLIKAVLAIEHREIPPHLHLEHLNPDISPDDRTISIPVRRTAWRASRRVAGVSSFGASGTNVHVVVEQPPAGEPVAEPALERPVHILALSARDEQTLAAQRDRFAAYLTGTKADIADICFTANAGRAHFPHRLAIVARGTAELAALLRDALSVSDPRVARGLASDATRAKVAFVFGDPAASAPGGITSGRELHDAQPTFRRAAERCDEIARAELQCSPLSALYGGPAEPAPAADAVTAAAARFTSQFALAELWRSWGISPSGVLGVGVGQYVAACVAGALELPDAMRLAAAYARAFEQQAAPAAGALEDAAKHATFVPSRLTFASAATGDCVSPDVALTRAAVDVVSDSGRFAEALAALYDKGHRVFLGLGSGPNAAEWQRNPPADALCLWTGEADWDRLLGTLATLYVRGCAVDWAGFDRDFARRKVLLPTYPFQRERFWVDSAAAGDAPEEDRLAPSAGPAIPARAATLTRATLAAAAPAQRAEMVMAFCGEQVEAVLRVGAVRPDQPLTDLGVDSLMAIELRNRIQRAVQVAIPVGSFLDGTSVEGVARLLLASLGESTSPERVAAMQPEVTPEEAQRLLGKIGTLSDAEVESLLAALAGGPSRQ